MGAGVTAVFHQRYRGVFGSEDMIDGVVNWSVEAIGGSHAFSKMGGRVASLVGHQGRGRLTCIEV